MFVNFQYWHVIVLRIGLLALKMLLKLAVNKNGILMQTCHTTQFMNIVKCAWAYMCACMYINTHITHTHMHGCMHVCIYMDAV